jgi:hypothetical protein
MFVPGVQTERANSVDSGAALQQLLPNKDSKFDTVGMGRKGFFMFDTMGMGRK